MELVRSLILIIALLVAPFLSGCLFGKQSVGKSYLRGVLLLWGSFELVCVAAFIRGWEFVRVSQLFKIVVFLLVGVGLVALLARKFKEGKAVLDKGDKKELFLEVLMILPAFCLVGSAFFLYMPKLESWYLVPETVTTILDTNSLHGYNPLTGQLLSTKKGLLEGLFNLPAFYACLINWFQIKQGMLLFRMIPLWVLFISFLVFYQFASFLFANWKMGRVAFLWTYSLVLFFGDKAYMNESYQMLHYAYEGRAILTGILLPYCFYLVSTVFLTGFEDGIIKWGVEYILLMLCGILVIGFDYGFGLLIAVTVLSVFAGVIGKAIFHKNCNRFRKVRKE